MYAIVEIAGQQFKVEAGNEIFVQRLADAKGADVEFKKVLLVADDAEGFADAVVRLLADVPMQERMAMQAEEKLARTYDPDRMLEHRMAVYREILP